MSRFTENELRENIMQAIGRAWCHEENVAKEMDPDLAGAVFWEVMEVLRAQLAERDPIGAAIMRERAISVASRSAYLHYETDRHEGQAIFSAVEEMKDIPLPTHAETLAYALQLPEINALVEATSAARDKAMHWSARARVPECGTFAEIAQDLDAALSALEPKP